jgi:hypothetical protein
VKLVKDQRLGSQENIHECDYRVLSILCNNGMNLNSLTVESRRACCLRGDEYVNRVTSWSFA